MTDYKDLIARLRLMEGIGDIQLNELMNRKTPLEAANAIEALASRVSDLESRLEIEISMAVSGSEAKENT